MPKFINGKKELKIGIIGLGTIGSALCFYLKRKKIKPFLYDPPKNIGSKEEINKADIVFIATPTPFNKQKGFDLSSITEQTLPEISGEKIIVIKSTILPGTTEKLQKQYPQHKFLFNPEFLTEKRAIKDMVKPGKQIIGYTERSKEIAKKILRILPRAPYQKIMPSTEAEMVKYFSNTFLAVKVIFGNQIYDLCQKIGINYGLVYRAASVDPRINPSHLNVFHGGYRGYGGKCLPKDIKALIQLADSLGVELGFHKKVEELNNKLMKKQGIKNPEIL